MNFFVTNKNNGDMYKVYDVVYNKAGYPHFLIYRNGEWVRMSAKHFRPHNQKDDQSSFDKMVTDLFDNFKR